MSNPRYVTAHGKTILVETLDIPPRKKNGKPKKEAWAQVPLLWAAEMAKHANSPRTTVLILLSYLAWKHNSATFPLSSEMARRYGITRYTKSRTLAVLEAAGAIKVDRRHKQSPVITLMLMPEWKV
jgi:hypothetical protein